MKASSVRIRPEIEALIRKKYSEQAAVSLQHAVDCLFADLFKQPRPASGVERMAASKIKPEEELTRFGRYKRRQREQGKK